MFDSWVMETYNQEYQTYLRIARTASPLMTCKYYLKEMKTSPTLMVFLGRRLANFLAAASIEAAAPNSSFSAITVGSSGSTQSVPVGYKNILILVLRKELG